MSDSFKDHRILHHLDAPFKVLFWSAQDAAILFGPVFILGFGCNQLLLGLVCSVLSFFAFRTINRQFGKGQITHALYWHLPHSASSLPTVPPSHIREYIG